MKLDLQIYPKIIHKGEQSIKHRYALSNNNETIEIKKKRRNKTLHLKLSWSRLLRELIVLLGFGAASFPRMSLHIASFCWLVSTLAIQASGGESKSNTSNDRLLLLSDCVLTSFFCILSWRARKDVIGGGRLSSLIAARWNSCKVQKKFILNFLQHKATSKKKWDCV